MSPQTHKVHRYERLIIVSRSGDCRTEGRLDFPSIASITAFVVVFRFSVLADKRTFLRIGHFGGEGAQMNRFLCRRRTSSITLGRPLLSGVVSQHGSQRAISARATGEAEVECGPLFPRHFGAKLGNDT